MRDQRWYQWNNPLLQLQLRIIPRAKKTEFGVLRGRWRIVRVKSPPIDGKANAELNKFLASTFGCSRSSIVLLQSEHNREKLIQINRPFVIPPELEIELTSGMGNI